MGGASSIKIVLNHLLHILHFTLRLFSPSTGYPWGQLKIPQVYGFMCHQGSYIVTFTFFFFPFYSELMESKKLSHKSENLNESHGDAHKGKNCMQKWKQGLYS